jgi:hypothetical protein
MFFSFLQLGDMDRVDYAMTNFFSNLVPVGLRSIFSGRDEQAAWVKTAWAVYSQPSACG